jgi:hypothetical protein
LVRKAFEREPKLVNIVHEFAADHAGGGHGPGGDKFAKFRGRDTYRNRRFGLWQTKHQWQGRKDRLPCPPCSSTTAAS